MNSRSSNLVNIFATPVWHGTIDDFEEINKKLLVHIAEMRKSNPDGVDKSNNLGWHSEDFNLTDEAPRAFLDKAKPIIKEAIDDMNWDLKSQTSRVTNMWSIINPKNSSNHRHIHPNCFLSSAYYVSAPENCGVLKLHDPRSAATFRKPQSTTSNELNSEVYNIVPKNGLLVLFPSYLHHSVANNNAEEERVVISFNIDLITKA